MKLIKLSLCRALPPVGHLILLCVCVCVCLGRWGVCIYTVDTTQGNLFVSAFLFADVCLCVHTHTRAHGGHNQLQMILSVCQLPRIAALVSLALANILATPCLPSHSLTLSLHSFDSLLKIISYFFLLVYPPAGLDCMSPINKLTGGQTEPPADLAFKPETHPL